MPGMNLPSRIAALLDMGCRIVAALKEDL